MANDTARPRALVTGASSGIGRAFSERLAREGYDLVLVARRRERLEELAGVVAKHGAGAEIISADLASHGDLAATERRAAAGDVAMLVNNAGFQNYMPFAEADPDRIEAQIAVQVTAPVRLARAALPGMLKRKSGAIVNVSSMLALSAGVDNPVLPKRATYSACKAYLNAFSELLARELAGTGVKVQALCPGVVRTEFHDLDGRPAALRPKVPLLEPDDVVQASIAALALGDVVVVPTIGDRALYDREREGRNGLFGAGFKPTLAERYAAKPG